jgi:hypothetical protein
MKCSGILSLSITACERDELLGGKHVAGECIPWARYISLVPQRTDDEERLVRFHSYVANLKSLERLKITTVAPPPTLCIP